MADEPAPLPQLRASDAEREQVADVLRRAAGEGRLDVDELDERLTVAYASRTHGELRELVADLGAPPAPATTGRRMPVRREGGRGTRFVVSVMSGAERAGHWRLGERLLVATVMGGADLDLNDAELSADETVITVVNVMGGCDIRVPDHLNVEVSTLGLMGGHDVRLGEHRPDPGGPVLRLRMLSVMGGGSVRRGRRQTRLQRREARRQRHLERRGHWH